MRKKIVMGTIGMLVMGTAMAQTSMNRSQRSEAIEAITSVGGTCEEIIRNQTVGKVDDQTTLMAVACRGGDTEQYVLALDTRGNMSFYATCENLAKGTDNRIRCFQ
jgi:hypothetical protein